MTLTTELLDSLEIDTSTEEINGVGVSVTEGSVSYSTCAWQTLHILGTNRFFKREGMMLIEYDRCVDVHWFSWEEE